MLCEICDGGYLLRCRKALLFRSLMFRSRRGGSSNECKRMWNAVVLDGDSRLVSVLRLLSFPIFVSSCRYSLRSCSSFRISCVWGSESMKPKVLGFCHPMFVLSTLSSPLFTAIQSWVCESRVAAASIYKESVNPYVHPIVHLVFRTLGQQDIQALGLILSPIIIRYDLAWSLLLF